MWAKSQYMILTNKYLSILDQDINKNNNNARVFGIPKKFLSVGWLPPPEFECMDLTAEFTLLVAQSTIGVFHCR